MKTAKTIYYWKEYAASVNGLDAITLEYLDELDTNAVFNDVASDVQAEPVPHAADASMHSIPVGGSHRIVCAVYPDEVFVLKIFPNEQALQYAATHIVRGGYVLPAEALPMPQEAVGTPLFEHVSDADLLRVLGFTGDISELAAIRSIRSEDSFKAAEEPLNQRFGIHSFDKLWDLYSGEPIEDIISVYGSTEEDPHRLGDFYVITDDDELQAMLDGSLEQWRIFLHPTQKQVAYRNYSGPARVTGGAGTGKTVAAMHRAAWLAKEQLEAGNMEQKILLTTYSKVLASDIRHNVDKLCGSDVQKSLIEVINLDAWAVQLLRAHNCLDASPRSDSRTRQTAWQTAYEARNKEVLPAEMNSAEMEREWREVILANGITTWEEYRTVSRVGRGIRLLTRQREAAWSVFADFRAFLDAKNMMEPEDVYRKVGELFQLRPDIAQQYSAVVVDESQDFGMAAFRMLGILVSLFKSPLNSLYITGDAHQRIYSRKVVLSRCGIEVRGRSRRLRINYRTTEENRQLAVAVLQGVSVDDLDGSEETLKGYRSLAYGAMPECCETRNRTEELAAIMARIKQYAPGTTSDRANICITLHSNALVEEYVSALCKAGIPAVQLKGAEPADKHNCSVRVATMHRVKGLEFDVVILAGMTNQYYGRYFHQNDRARADELRSLFHVAASRPRKRLFITSDGKMLPELRSAFASAG